MTALSLLLTQHAKTSGPGLTAATVNQPTDVIVELIDSFGMPCSIQLNVTAEMESISEEATPTSQPHRMSLPVEKISPSLYKVSYTAVNQGQCKLHVLVNEKEINGSPFPVSVHPDPSTLRLPKMVVSDLNRPCAIAINTQGEMIVSELHSHKLSTCNTRGQKIRKIPSGDSQYKIDWPRGIAIDNEDNIYVTSKHRLQKFASSGELIKYVGQKGKNKGDFNDPHGVALYEGEVYVCDSDNHRIQVFDLDLKFCRSIGSRGTGKGEFNAPRDVKFDISGNMYVAEFKNKRVQIMDIEGEFIQEFGEGKLCGPTGLHIADKNVYVSDYSGHCIVVYETSGQFVTSFGIQGHKEGEFDCPMCITSCADGFIYVCDCHNDRVQVF
jgi:DNA-binding beta-propeller fold protein YncE